MHGHFLKGGIRHWKNGPANVSLPTGHGFLTDLIATSKPPYRPRYLRPYFCKSCWNYKSLSLFLEPDNLNVKAANRFWLKIQGWRISVNHMAIHWKVLCGMELKFVGKKKFNYSRNTLRCRRHLMAIDCSYTLHELFRRLKISYSRNWWQERITLCRSALDCRRQRQQLAAAATKSCITSDSGTS